MGFGSIFSREGHISVAIIGRGAGHSARRSGARFRHVLGSQGYAISEAPNAKTAIELVETEKPDLILLDPACPAWAVTNCCANGGTTAWMFPSSSFPAASRPGAHVAHRENAHN
jgi:hypothetical protein